MTCFILSVTACGGGSSSSGDPSSVASGTASSQQSSVSTSSSTSGASADTSGNSESTPIDITSTILSNRSGDCADYVGSYSSSVVDVNRGEVFSGSMQIEATEDVCNLVSNSIPNHNFNNGPLSFPNETKELEQSFVIYRNPVVAEDRISLDHRTLNAILLNGAPVDILSAGCWDGTKNVATGCSQGSQWLIDPVGSNGFFSEDTHNAHTQPNGMYHYHGDPSALYDENPGPNGSPVIGFAADGFPIYGPYFLDPNSGQVREARSGYSLKDGDRVSGPPGAYDGFYNDDWVFTNAGDLDECNGMSIEGQYGYYLTASYPWIIKCYIGTPHFSFRK